MNVESSLEPLVHRTVQTHYLYLSYCCTVLVVLIECQKLIAVEARKSNSVTLSSLVQACCKLSIIIPPNLELYTEVS